MENGNIKTELFIAYHPLWCKVVLRINDKESGSQIREELQKACPSLSRDYIEETLKEFLFEDEVLADYVDETETYISFESTFSSVESVVQRVRDRVNDMLSYLSEKR